MTGLDILVGDDQPDVLEALRLLLKSAGHKATPVDSPAAVLAAAQGREFDLILIDLNYARDTTSGQEGLDLVSALQERRVKAPIVVMTAWGSVDLAVAAMQRGAADFVQKPWDNQRLLEGIEKLYRRTEERQSAERQARSEWEIARNVQQKLFPQPMAALATVEIAGQCVPARAVSGDYYDFFDLGPGRLGFLLADVSGKGIGAALLMANLQAAFRTQTDLGGKEPAAMLASIHRQFHASTPPEHYATLFYGEYDERARRLRYVNCGHPPPLLIRRAGQVERLEVTSTIFGMFPGWNGEERGVDVQPGDCLLVFSDGVTEAGSARDDDYGEERLVASCRSFGPASMAEFVDAALDAVRRHEPVPADDCTLVGLKFR